MRIVYFGIFFFSGLFTFLFLFAHPLGEVQYLNPGEEEFLPQRVELENVFDGDHTWVATLSAERVLVMKVTGDVIPARTVNAQTIQRGDFLWPYSETAEFLSDADITYIDLETPLINDCPISNEGFKFCGDSRHVEGLSLMGVDVANIANNHIGNFGIEGVMETVGHLKDKGILSSGVSDVVYLDKKGVKFAFLGYNDIDIQAGVNTADESLIKAQIKEAAKKADVVVVQFHWGVEYVSQPSTRQRELAHLAIDNGADLVIGNHPHWIQPFEKYRNGIIVYAHGNFIFDQMWSEKTREGVVGTYIFYDDKLIDVTFSPIIIYDYGQPRFVEGDDAERILRDFYSESFRLEE